MRVMTGFIHRGYTYVFNPIGTPDGRFYDAFSVHKHAGDESCNLRITAFQRSITEAERFDSEDQAMASACKLAEAWIDEHQ